MPMTDPVSGGCSCGAIRFEYSGEPVLSLNCHCRDCQHASGSAFASFVVVWKESFRLRCGEPKYHAKVSDAGNTMRRGFCAECGSPITILEPHRPKLAFIHAASLDDPSTYKPTMDIFTASAHPWDVMNPKLEKFAGMPPVPDSLGR